jgi:putative FmdB family regulatory protein
MPIYAYRCTSCGHAQDVLQKISDPVLTSCPACGAESFAKQVTAAGFQLKGSGWYVTDFRDGNKGAKKDEPKQDEPKKDEPKKDEAAKAPASDAAAPAAPAAAPAAADGKASAPAPAAPAPAPSAGS